MRVDLHARGGVLVEFYVDLITARYLAATHMFELIAWEWDEHDG